MEKILVTGCSGFIGMHLCERLLKNKYAVHGIDNLEGHYDISLKKERLNNLLYSKNFSFKKTDITSLSDTETEFKNFKPDKVVNLAAKAGVRKSLKIPQSYVQTNINGFINVVESCINFNVDSLIYASSSSVYGANNKIPFSTSDRTDRPISIYAATKKANELIASTYNHLYSLKTTGLRFFTVYGPWGRPDMAMYIFAEKIWKNEKIPLFNHGNSYRDFTYIDDIVDGIQSSLKYNYLNEVFNLGNNKSENIMDVIRIMEKELGRKAKISFMDIQPGDVEKTFANIDYEKEKLNYNPKTSITIGIEKFIKWFKSYHSIV
tara:strand:+ start:1605 stop:2564 length:960 start_codon:yes stop_codon:yes gene_type:complete